MIIAQVATIKGHSKAVLSHRTMPQMSQVLRERAIGMLTAGMSTRAVARELNVNFSTMLRGLDLTAVCRRNRLEWANTHIRWRLALWRGALFTDESRFSLYRADGSQHV